MADPGINATVAWLSAPGDQVAGCAFLWNERLAITCAHVIRRHLDIPETPTKAPQNIIRLNFPARSGCGAMVAPEGWWPDFTEEDRHGELQDLAVLVMKEPQDTAHVRYTSPQRPGLGEGFRCIGYPPGHQRHGLGISGNLGQETALGWLQLNARSGQQDHLFVEVGFSGAPVYDERLHSILGMIAEIHSQNKLLAYAIPAADLRRAVKAVEAAHCGFASAHQNARDETSAAISAETRSSVERPVSDLAAQARGYAVSLRSQVEIAHNQMPENFKADVVGLKLKALQIELGRGQLRPLELGIHAAFLIDLALAIDERPTDNRPELQALVPLAGDILAALDKMGSPMPALGTEKALWPPGVTDDLIRRLQEIEDGLNEIDPLDVEDVLEAAHYHVLMLRSEAEREWPDWPVVRHEASSLDQTLKGSTFSAYTDGTAFTDTTTYADLASDRPTRSLGRSLDEAHEGSGLRHVSRLAARLANMLRETAGDVIRSLPPLRSFQELPETPEMVVVQPGPFLMGSPEDDEEATEEERPRHRVTFAKAFAIGRYPVTFSEFDAFCTATGRTRPPDQGWGRERRPVINVSWDDAEAYCQWLSGRTGSPYRLPSEAEWEYACRAGTTSRRWWGGAIGPERANYDRNLGQTAPVGQYAPNSWRLYDTLGNVWEWCADRWHEDYRGAPQDGSAWTGGETNGLVLRGGSWLRNPRYLRSGCRGRIGSDDRVIDIGFRVAMSLC